MFGIPRVFDELAKGMAINSLDLGARNNKLVVVYSNLVNED